MRDRQQARILRSQIAAAKAAMRSHALGAEIAARQRASELSRVADLLESEKASILSTISNCVYLEPLRDEWRRWLESTNLTALDAGSRLNDLLLKIEIHVQVPSPPPRAWRPDESIWRSQQDESRQRRQEQWRHDLEFLADRLRSLIAGVASYQRLGG